MMQCQEAVELISAALDGELAPRERAVMKTHVDGCGECQRRGLELTAVDEALRAPAARPLRAPLSLRERIEATLPRRAERRPWIFALALAGAFAAGAVVISLARPRPLAIARGVVEVHAGDPVRAGAEPIEVEIPGRVRATLQPHGQLVLVDRNELRLDHGRVSVDVRPGADAIRVTSAAGELSAFAATFDASTTGQRAEDAADITVREGRVRIRTSAGVAVASAGDSYQFSARGATRRGLRARDVVIAAAVNTAASPAAAAPTIVAPPAATTPPPATTTPAAEPPPAALPTAVAAAPAALPERVGTVAGTVTVQGFATGRDLRGSPCGSEPWTVTNGRLANVVVSLSAASAAAAPRPAAAIAATPCGPVPRVAAVAVGQPFDLSFSASVQSFRAVAPSGVLVDLRAPTAPLRRTLQAEQLVSLFADAEQPNGFVLVTSHTHFAVTDDNGAFTLENVPPGAHRLRAWHERGGERFLDVVVEPGQTTQARLAFTYVPPPVATLVIGDCRQVTADSLVALACAQGGRARAKAVMKDLVKRAKARGVKVDCDDCHRDEERFTLTDTAREELKRLLAIVHG